MKLRNLLIMCIGVFVIGPISAQKPYIEGGSVKEQFEYVQEKASRWQNYTMLPDPWFSLLKTNAMDTLKEREKQISDLKKVIEDKNKELANINAELSQTHQELEQTIIEKDSFSTLGMELRKGFFMKLISFIFIGLIVITTIAVLFAKREILAAKRARKDMEQLKQEFEDYRQDSRIKREKLVVQHHREIQKLKGG